jgi:hypothetical protein
MLFLVRCETLAHVLETQFACFRYGFFLFSKDLLLFSTEKSFFVFVLITFFFFQRIYRSLICGCGSTANCAATAAAAAARGELQVFWKNPQSKEKL